MSHRDKKMKKEMEMVGKEERRKGESEYGRRRGRKRRG